MGLSPFQKLVSCATLDKLFSPFDMVLFTCKRQIIIYSDSMGELVKKLGIVPIVLSPDFFEPFKGIPIL